MRSQIDTLAKHLQAMVLVLAVGVPLGAVVGLLTLGVFAVVVAIVIAAVVDPSDAPNIVSDLPVPHLARRKRT